MLQLLVLDVVAHDVSVGRGDGDAVVEDAASAVAVDGVGSRAAAAAAHGDRGGCGGLHTTAGASDLYKQDNIDALWLRLSDISCML